VLTLEPQAGVRPILVLAVGNPSRGDDALGPVLAERLQALRLPDVEVLSDYQLQVEHALDMIGRALVVVVDAAASGAAPYAWSSVSARPDRSVSTHALSPDALLACHRRLTGAEPRTLVLAVRGFSFRLGASLSRQARQNLERALPALLGLLSAESGVDGKHGAVRVGEALKNVASKPGLPASSAPVPGVQRAAQAARRAAQ
jgi:hydrogenase maturation protease